jgi:hypothetical protein
VRRTFAPVLLPLLAAVACASRSPRSPSVDSACGDSEALLLGACVSTKTADAYCGAGARFVRGVCSFRTCEAAHALDVTTGECVPMRTLRDIAAADGSAIFAGEGLECEDGRAPVVDAAHVACVLGDGACPRGTKAGAGVVDCTVPPRCAVGAIYDERASVCTAVLGRSDGARRPVVDVGTWLRLAVGPDGGEGARPFCQPLALHAAEAGLKPGDPLEARVTVELRVPDEDVRAAYATVDGVSEESGERLSDAARARLEASTRPLVAALQALGGDASATDAEVHVRCSMKAGGRPAPIHLVGPPR